MKALVRTKMLLMRREVEVALRPALGVFEGVGSWLLPLFSDPSAQPCPGSRGSKGPLPCKDDPSFQTSTSPVSQWIDILSRQKIYRVVPRVVHVHTGWSGSGTCRRAALRRAELAAL